MILLYLSLNVCQSIIGFCKPESGIVRVSAYTSVKVIACIAVLLSYYSSGSPSKLHPRDYTIYPKSFFMFLYSNIAWAVPCHGCIGSGWSLFPFLAIEIILKQVQSFYHRVAVVQGTTTGKEWVTTLFSLSPIFRHAWLKIKLKDINNSAGSTSGGCIHFLEILVNSYPHSHLFTNEREWTALPVPKN